MGRKYLAPDRLQIVAVGDQSKTETSLRNFGPVSVFDDEGKELSAAPASR